jgi:hypothetical protein
MARGDGAETLI